MSSKQIGPEVHKFIAQHINAAEQLDILLLLHGSPDRDWSAADVSQAIFTVPTAATVRLEALAAAGFVRSSGGTDPRYRFDPSSDALRDQVDQLAAAYRADRVGVINLVFQKPVDPIQSFADAFRLRRD